jgi:hypothetical protein
LDFTRLNSRQVGALHSRYAVRHSFAIYKAAEEAAKLAVSKRNLKLAQARFRAKHKRKYKTKYELDDVMLEDDLIVDLLEQVEGAEIKLKMIEAVAQGYEDLRNAASREMFRRSSEQAPRHDH